MLRKIERAALPFTILGWVAFFLAFNFITQPRAEQQVGPSNAILCNQGIVLNIGSSGLTKIVTGGANTVIAICGWHVTNSASSGTFQLSTGTGTNCGTGTANLTPAFTVTSTAPATDHIDFAMLSVAKATDLCINPSVNTIAAVVWVAQY